MSQSTVRWWQWPTVLSLDAPLVAVAWQGLFARAAGVGLGPAPRFVLGAAVWLAYAGDRWIEGWRLDPAAIRTQRHSFYQRWRWPVCALGSLVALAGIGAAVRDLPARDIGAGFGLLGLVLIYLLSHQLVHRGHPWRLPKEVCVAVLFGLGAALFVLLSGPGAPARLGLPLALFIVLCFTNCALISVWEQEVDRSHGQVSFSGQFPGAVAFTRSLPWVGAVGAALAWRAADGPARSAVLCAGASSLLLGWLDRAEPRLGRRAARVLADAALLTPLVPLLIAR